MTTDAKLMTAEEFALLPAAPEGGKMELVDGEVVTMPPVGLEHAETASELLTRLRAFAREHALGLVVTELGFRLRSDPDLVRAPDISFIQGISRRDASEARGFRHGPPTLAVEVVSPGDRADEVNAKVAEYLAAGTERVWVVQPNVRRVTVHWPNGDAHTYGPGDVLTSREAAFAVDGFALPVDEIFA